MPDNPFDPSSLPGQVPVYQTGNPFTPSADPNALGGLGFSQGLGTSLMQFGANTAAAANARTSGGFLANGPGFLGPAMAGIGATLKQGQEDVNTRAGYNALQARTIGQQLSNQKAGLELPLLQLTTQQQMFFRQHPEELPKFLRQLNSGSPTVPGASAVGPQSSNGTGTDTQTVADLSDPISVPGTFQVALRGLEAPKPGASPFNQKGYLGDYQFGTGALASAGLYHPGEGEDLAKNQWSGKIVVPGYDPMTATEFAANHAAQDKALDYHMGHLSKVAQQLGLDKYIGQTIAGVPITHDTLAAMMHFAGPAGAEHFLASGGQFNPKDANGTSVAAYAGSMATRIAASAGNTRTTTSSATPPVTSPSDSTTTEVQPTSTGTEVPPAVQGDVAAMQAGMQRAAASMPGYHVAQAGDGVQPPPTATPTEGPQISMGGAASAPTLGGSAGPPISLAPPAIAPTQTVAPPVASSQPPQPARTGAPPAANPIDTLVAQSRARAQQLLIEASNLEQQQAVAKWMGLPPPAGDPTLLRQLAEKEVDKALSAGYTVTTDRVGNRYVGGTYLGRGSQVEKTYNQNTGQEEYTDLGGIGSDGQATPPVPTGVVASPNKITQKSIEGQLDIRKADIDQDRKLVEEEYSHVVDRANSAKIQALALKNLAPDAFTGPGGQWRAAVRAWVQQYAPASIGRLAGDASPAQEFNKIALMQAGSQERDTMGSRGGIRALEMYKDANPNLDMNEAANGHMANVLAISRQAEIDYALGAGAHYQRARNEYDQATSARAQSSNQAQQAIPDYDRVHNYDERYTRYFKPELYYAAMNAINGKASSDWGKNMSARDKQIVYGIVARTDPSASINFGGGHLVPATTLRSISPNEIDQTEYPLKGKQE